MIENATAREIAKAIEQAIPRMNVSGLDEPRRRATAIIALAIMRISDENARRFLAQERGCNWMERLSIFEQAVVDEIRLAEATNLEAYIERLGANANEEICFSRAGGEWRVVFRRLGGFGATPRAALAELLQRYDEREERE